MGLLGKLSVQIEIKTRGDVFHELFTQRPHHVPSMSPGLVHGCDVEGDGASVGSLLLWKYTHDGKQKAAKQLIEALDEEKKSVRLKLVEGGALELFKTFTTIIQVEENGETIFVIWTLEYEKKDENVEDPVKLLSFFINLTKDIESHHLKN